MKEKLALLGFFLFAGLLGFTQPKDGHDRNQERLKTYNIAIHKPGELKQRIPEKIVPSIRKLKIRGVLSREDVQFLKRLALRSSLKDTLGNKLEPFFDVDLSDATIPSDYRSSAERSQIPADFMRGSTILRRIVLPINTEHIGNGAFNDCRMLRDIQIPMGVKTIGNNAFGGDDNLTTVSLPRTLEGIGASCYEGCKNLKQIAIPSGVRSIGEKAFKNTGISVIKMPETIESIGSEAFANTNIEFLEIPTRLGHVNRSAFSGCNKLQNIYVAEDNPNYSDIDGVLTNKQRTVIIKAPIVKAGAYTIPKSVVAIDDYAFYNCRRITAVTFPTSLKRIGEGAFQGCSGLAA